MSTYSSGYSGIGASPLRSSPAPSASEIIRRGWASVKEDGFASFLWARKFLILRDQTLSFHKNEVRQRPAGLLALADNARVPYSPARRRT